METLESISTLFGFGAEKALQPPRFAKVTAVSGDAVTVKLGTASAEAVRCCACSAGDVVLLETMPNGTLAAVGARGGGVVPISNGGTGATTAKGAWLNLENGVRGRQPYDGTSGGWYILADGYVTNGGNAIVLLLVYDTIPGASAGILRINVRRNTDSTMSIYDFTWVSAVGIDPNDYVVTLDTTNYKWVLHVRRNTTSAYRSKVVRLLDTSQLLGQQNLSNVTFYSPTAAESTTPSGIVSAAAPGVVTEYGTSGIWAYRKYADGTSECWGNYVYTVTQWNAWGSLYYSQPFGTTSYPAGLFVAAPVETVSLKTQGADGFISTRSGTGDATVTRSYFLARPTAGATNVAATLSIHAVGRWM